MKLRTRGNSVRLRLQQGEVRELVARGKLEEQTSFGLGPKACLTYGVELSDEATGVHATWLEGRLTVRVPTALGRAWAEGAEVALEAHQPVGDGATLRILLEKDLACVRENPRQGEDDGDAYPNPADHC